jgi:hypothetical protein
MTALVECKVACRGEQERLAGGDRCALPCPQNAYIRLLHEIVDIRQRRKNPTEPGPQRRFVRQDFFGEPAVQFGLRGVHGRASRCNELRCAIQAPVQASWCSREKFSGSQTEIREAAWWSNRTEMVDIECEEPPNTFSLRRRQSTRMAGSRGGADSLNCLMSHQGRRVGPRGSVYSIVCIRAFSRPFAGNCTLTASTRAFTWR